MLTSRIRRPSAGTVLGTLALFVALGGPAWAAKLVTSANIKNNTITSVDVKDGGIQGKDLKADTLTGREIAESKLAKVPEAAKADAATTAASAATATSATTAGSAATAKAADTAKSADSAATATSAGDSAKLGGAAAADYAKKADLLTPAFTDGTLTNSWAVYDLSIRFAPGYTKDALGFVHLRGAAKAGTSGTSAFTLPVGMRPAQDGTYTASCFAGDAVVLVNKDGTVVPSNVGGSNCTVFASFDGIVFQAG